nr:hypothetical protein WMHIBSEC_WMHIBSEC_CDS_0047 [Caudoviricetes sp.]CAI9751776.1 hypothetical protein AZFZUZMX_AZFZUZMX_CDS_0047 [Caudoviricetes sp.]
MSKNSSLTCKSCLYRRLNSKTLCYYCKKRKIRIGKHRKFCEMYEPK